MYIWYEHVYSILRHRYRHCQNRVAALLFGTILLSLLFLSLCRFFSFDFVSHKIVYRNDMYVRTCASMTNVWHAFILRTV